MMNDIEEVVAVDTQLPEDPYSPLQAGGDAGGSRHGEILSCRRCQTASLASHKFCPQCGEPLWEPCVHCGTVCPAGERFCGLCVREPGRRHPSADGAVRNEPADGGALAGRGPLR